MMVWLYFSGIFPLNDKPIRLPRMMLKVLTTVPSNASLPLWVDETVYMLHICCFFKYNSKKEALRSMVDNTKTEDRSTMVN
jgi:hypothetical protein